MSERARKEQTMKEFTKSDLKDRMVVEYRNGYRRMVVGDRLMGINGSGYLDDFNEDLTMQDSPSRDFDIIRVYKPIDILDEIRNVNSCNKIWQRSEVKEVTMTEVEEKFGCKVKIVKE